MKSLIPKKLESKKEKIKLRPLMEEGIVPGPNDAFVFVGASKSGKTTAFVNMLCDEDVYKDYFDEVYLFSLSAGLDDSFDNCNIKPENKFDGNFIKKTREIIQKQQADIKGGSHKKYLLIYEDSTGAFKLLKSPEFVYIFTMGRHLLLTVVCMVHKYKSIPPAIRLNANQLCIFPCNGDQVKQIVDDYCPSYCDKKTFKKMIATAFEKTEEFKHPWLTIDNNNMGNEKNFRKGWTDYIVHGSITIK